MLVSFATLDLCARDVHPIGSTSLNPTSPNEGRSKRRSKAEALRVGGVFDRSEPLSPTNPPRRASKVPPELC